jgi:hypothetical protein
LTELGTAFGAWINDKAVPYLLANLPIWLTKITDWLTGTAIPRAAEALGHLAEEFGIVWFTKAVPWLEINLAKFAFTLADWITGTLWPDAARMLVHLADEFATWVIDAEGKMYSNLGQLGNRLLQWITDRVPDLVNYLGQWIRAFVDFPMHVVEQLPNELSNVLKAINEWVDSILPRLEAKGRDMANALLHGLGNMAGNIIGGIGGVLGIGGGSSSGGGGPDPGGGFHTGYWDNGQWIKYADGGWLNEPVLGMGMNSGNRYSFAESGAELILNQSQVRGLSSGGSGGGNTTVINVHVAGSIMTARGMAEDVRTELLRMQRQGIQLGFT